MTELDINDYLEKDPVRVPGQEFAVISIISPTSNQKYDKIAVKIRGTFSDMEQANKFAAKLQKMDATFDIFVVEMYSWLVLPPETTAIGEKHYANDELDTLIKSHIKEQEEAKPYEPLIFFL